MKAQFTNKMMPAEMVSFDFNPEVLTVSRTASSNSNTSPSGPKGATPSIFRGQPASLKAFAYLEGSDVKSRADQMLAWCEPGGGMLGKAAGAALGAMTGGRMNLASKLPVLIFTWGPFLMECVLNSVTVSYERFDKSGDPTRGKVDFTVKEEPSLLGMLPTNPSSGGVPGRKRHVVSQGETLALIAARTYGHPGLWRAVADANGIDDPFRMTPGRVLLLPSVSEPPDRGADAVVDVVDVSPHVVPTIVFDGQELSDEIKAKLIHTIVDTHLHLPDMFEIAFEDNENSVLTNIKIGSTVEVFGGAPATTMASKLVGGEVTAIEGDYEDSIMRTVIRGYDKSHRFQRVCRTRTFVDMTDADIAKKIALDAKFSPKDITIDDTRTTHQHMSQVAQTDWDFLTYRAREIGYEVGVSGSTFYFRKASSAGGGGGGGLGPSMPSVPSPLGGGGDITLSFKKNLIAFYPRLSSAGLVTDVEIRVWDPETAAVVVGAAPVKTVTAKLKDDPAKLAQAFPATSSPLPSPPKIPGLPDFGLAPSASARLVVDRPLHRGSSLQTAADEAAVGLAEQIGSTFAEAEGVAYGDAGIQPGQAVTIDGVPEEFNGKWVVTNARHTFIPEEGGYRTRFVVSGRHDRSLLGLASADGNDSARTINGLVPAVVTNNNDPDTMGRVKVAFPWLAPNYESDWARVAQYGMGKKWGGLFLPEVGDEVLVGFEFGDVRRPYVLGGVINGKTEHDLVADAVKTTPPLSQVTKRGFVSRLGNRLVFEDEDQGPVPTKSSITIGDKDGKVQIVVDKKNGQIKITCDSTMPPSKIVIEQKGPGGSIEVKADGNISLEAATAGKVSIKGGAGVSIDGSPGTVEIKGSVIKLN